MRLALKSSSPPEEVALLRIRPPSGWASLDWRELWDFRELLYFLIWRDLKVRYKQSVLGVAWVVLQPLSMTLVFTIIFGGLARLPSGELPYAVFAIAGLAPWSFFGAAVARGAGSLVANSNLLGKVYFPRLIIPLASVLSGLVDLVINLVLAVVVGLFFGLRPGLSMLLLLPVSLWLLAASLGLSLILAPLFVRYRDIGYVIPVVMQFWFYASPVVYASTVVPEKFRALYGLNPLASLIEAFRWAMFGGAPPPASWVIASLVGTVLLLVVGHYVFRRMEDSFADVV